MLVLSRKSGESVVIGAPGNHLKQVLKVTLLGVDRGKVRLGFEAAEDVPVNRFEVWQRICAGASPSRSVVIDGDAGYQC